MQGTGEERRCQSLCDKRDNNNILFEITFHQTSLPDLLVKDQTTLI